MKNFALTGAAGYIAPRHMAAIKDTGNQLLAAMDPNDSVGIIDSYFPEAAFFTEFERFDRHCDKLKRKNQGIDYLSICTPNYLHDAHIRFALRSEMHAICEKPIVLNPWNLDALQVLERENGKQVYNILQLRLHDSINELKAKIDNGPKDKIYEMDLSYITSRGKWYHHSWKGDVTKSGGVATNIGVHFFDMLGYLFGKNTMNEVHLHEGDRAAGYLEFERARVRWFLSTDIKYVPQNLVEGGQRTYRSLQVGEDEIEFSGGFTELHRKSYEDILSGGGFGLEETRQAIDIVSDIRSKGISSKGEKHPFLQR